ncbi:MAG: adenylosuccinate synthase [Flavobacteriales bacterium]
MSKVDVLLGLQWGDEGKGKIVDVLAPHYQIIARFQGGPNAGHSLEFNGQKFVLHTIPSGIFREGTVNLIGNGVVIDPVTFKKEIENLEKAGVDVVSRLLISRKAHLILPTHKVLDAASEASKGTSKIGSTLKGIGPTYMDKTGRNGLRVGDVELDTFTEKYNQLKNKHEQLIELYHYEYDVTEAEQLWFESLETLRRFTFIDSEDYLHKALAENKKILAEGAQGTMLDIDFGSYPFVTSSNTITAGACTGLGIAPNKIGEVFGIFKAYCTRVGSGPFPTELENETGQALRDIGREYGATTGRPRRTGWLDIPALNYACRINGVTKLLMMKADVLSGFETLEVATSYNYNGQNLDHLPYDVLSGRLLPVFEQLKGWHSDLTGMKDISELPAELETYTQFIEEKTGVPVSVISVGPDREQTLIRKNIFA